MIMNPIRSAIRGITMVKELLLNVVSSTEGRLAWRKYLSNKSVSIVGPAPMNANYNSEIEDSDIIIRVGFEHWPWLNTGNRTDAWVLCSGNSRLFLDGLVSELQAAWVMLKPGTKITFQEALRIRRNNKDPNKPKVFFASRPIILYKLALSKFRSHPVNLNQVPIALLDLYLSRPKSVGVYGSNYYLGTGIYSPGSPDYSSSTSGRIDFTNKMFQTHDQLVQKEICQQVIKKRRNWGSLGSKEFLDLTLMDTEEFEKLIFLRMG